MKKLQNKTALITGAARGIGAETARLLAEHGASVFVADILEEQAQQVTAEINQNGGQAAAINLDVSSESGWQSAVDEILSASGKLDILVNNAGTFLGKGFEEASLVEWQKLVDINMTSVF